MPSLLDLMSPEDKAKAIEKGKRRLEKREKQDVSPELYIVAELGTYLNWDAILAIKRGYIEKTDAKGNVVKEPFTLDEALALLDALRKVRYTHLIENARANLVAVHSAKTRDPNSAFNHGIKPFKEKSKL